MANVSVEWRTIANTAVFPAMDQGWVQILEGAIMKPSVVRQLYEEDRLITEGAGTLLRAPGHT